MIAIARAFLGALAEERVHGFAGRHGIFRELIAEIGESELEAIGKFLRVGDGFGQVGKEAGHFLRAFQMPFGVDGKQAAGFGDCYFVADAGEDVEGFARLRSGVADAVGGEQRQMMAAREIDKRLIAGFLGCD